MTHPLLPGDPGHTSGSRRQTLKTLASLVALTGAGGSLLAPGAARAQGAYPSRPIKLVVPFAPGGGVDLIARVVGQKLGERLGQSIVIDNKAGASSMLGTDLVAKSAPDGYTLLMSSSSIAANQSLFKKVPYDPRKDFLPIGMVANAPAIVTVHPGVQARTLQQFVALARSAKDPLPYASFGAGSAPHLVTELFEAATGTKMLHIPYKGGGPAVLATLAGETSLIIPSMVPVLQHIKDGKLRALGIASERRHPLLPDVPTLREQGVPLETGTWFGILAPAGLPPAIASRLTAELGEVLKDKDVQTRLISEGAEVTPMEPRALGAFIESETRRWRDVVAKAGIQPE
jgi:tripartite-type tricarboxylate transporter receptor subunit TctC